MTPSLHAAPAPRRRPRIAPALVVLAGTLLQPAPPGRGQTPTTAAVTDDARPSPPSADLASLERAYRAESDERKRIKLVQDLAQLPPPGAAELLARIVESDPSDEVALTATYSLRRARLGEVVRGLERRLGTGPRDTAARERLVREIERHQVFGAGQNLPHFMREAPPPFTVGVKAKEPASGRSVRVLAIGDFGDGSSRQQRVAAAIRALHGTARFDLAVTVGDNFYPAGMAGPDDRRWDQDFERLYGGLRIPFFATLGNHDWLLADSPASEIAHTAVAAGGHWRMPAQRYTFLAGSAQFFAIDTNLLSRAQLEWLDRELGRSTARWKIVYGHHPIYSYGAHGDEPAVRDKVLPLLRGRANLYLCGHEHDLQVLRPEEGVHFVIAGGGGAAPRPITPGARSQFASSRNGFAVLDIGRDELAVRLVGDDERTLHRFVVKRAEGGRPGAAAP